jgi:hypothetical protein
LGRAAVSSPRIVNPPWPESKTPIIEPYST